MPSQQPNKRPPRQPLSPEEVIELVKLKKLKQQYLTEKFKQTKRYKYLNIFNVLCIVVYAEIICAFIGVCNFSTYQAQSVVPYYGEKIVGGKRTVSTLVFTSTEDKVYDVGVNDSCTVPLPNTQFNVGRDWILQKEIKVQLMSGREFFIKRASPLLFISVLLSIVTYVLFGYNLNQIPYSLNAISLINTICLLSFMLL